MFVLFSKGLSRLQVLARIAGTSGLVVLLSGCGVSQTATGGNTTVNGNSVAGSVQGLIYSGAYAPNTPYGVTDVVTYQGSAYVALTISMNVPPVGGSASAADWALLVAAGQNGAQGMAGATGTPGARGAQGPLGAQGPVGLTGPRGSQGLQGVQGATGVSGAAGLAGIPGVAGPPGVPGATGPMGPSGPTGPAGSAGADATAQTVSALRGHGLGILGDSISAANGWQPVVVSRTGATITFQDARPGRKFTDAFECYGALSPPSAPGVFQPTSNCLYPGDVSVVGDTLAQNLATTDMLLIRLGTNDQNIPLGSLGDATNAGTFYGNMRWVVETLLTAKPTLRVILITPELNRFAPVPSIQNVVDAEIAYANSMGLPVLDLYRTSGNNALTNPVYTYDGTHPTGWAYQNVDGPAIAQFVLRWF